MNKKIADSDRDAASWYVIFSGNEMVVITAKGNALGIRQVSDLAKPDVKFVRITGAKDLGAGRTIEFLKRAAALKASRSWRRKSSTQALSTPPSRRQCPKPCVPSAKATPAPAWFIIRQQSPRGTTLKSSASRQAST
jgi:ABC-type molybdate transport system, periplasmic component